MAFEKYTFKNVIHVHEREGEIKKWILFRCLRSDGNQKIQLY